MDPYCEKIQVFLGEVQRQIQDFEKKLEQIQKTYLECCEFYLIDKGDEKAQNSQEFFKFFTQFVDQVVKALPKEEKKRQQAKPSNAPKHQLGQKIGGMDSVISEMKKK